MSVFVAILICLVLSAFFSGMEIAFMASNKLRIEIDKSNKGITQDFYVRLSGSQVGKYRDLVGGADDSCHVDLYVDHVGDG